MMKQVDLQGTKNGVGLANVQRIIIDRGEKGEVIITENNGLLSIYGQGRVLYSEESSRPVTRGRGQVNSTQPHRAPVGTGVCIGDD